MKPVWKWLGAGAAMAVAGAVAGAAAWYTRERLVERPKYRLIEEDRDIEIRVYPALLAAETVQPGDRGAALDAGFALLADYFFARSRGGERSEDATLPGTAATRSRAAIDASRIAMTAPVLADPAPDAAGWRTRFILPRALTRGTLPNPPGQVAIVDIPERRMAAIRFPGKADDRLLADKEEELRAWLARRRIDTAGPVEHGFYNSPFIPAPLRHNEVLIPIL